MNSEIQVKGPLFKNEYFIDYTYSGKVLRKRGEHKTLHFLYRQREDLKCSDHQALQYTYQQETPQKHNPSKIKRKQNLKQNKEQTRQVDHTIAPLQ